MAFNVLYFLEKKVYKEQLRLKYNDQQFNNNNLRNFYLEITGMGCFYIVPADHHTVADLRIAVDLHIAADLRTAEGKAVDLHIDQGKAVDLHTDALVATDMAVCLFLIALL